MTELDPAELITDGTDATFMSDVIEPSKSVPVIVDFWAPWCGPCRQLLPALEKVVRAEGGKVKMVKINIDENPGISGQLRVQSIPAVFAFKDGQPIDGFMGGQPDSELKKFVGRLTGSVDTEAESNALLERAMESLQKGDVGGAAQDLAKSLQAFPENAVALAALARLYLNGGAPEQAQALLDNAPDSIADHSDIVSVRAALELQGEAASVEPEIDDAPDATAPLKAAVEASPDDLDARLELAKALAAAGDHEGAIEHCLYSVAKNRAHDDEAARKFLITIFAAEGSDSELAKSGRARLSSILFA